MDPALMRCAGKHLREVESAEYFLNRVRTRFDGGGPYLNFLDCVDAFRHGRTTAAALSAEVAELFADHDDLFRDFRRFFPEPPPQRPGKRKNTAEEQPGKKSRRGGASPPPPAEKLHNWTEIKLGAIDAILSRWRSAVCSADALLRRFSAGQLKPYGIRLDGENFTEMDLVCVKRLEKKFPEALYLNELVDLRNALASKERSLAAKIKL